MGEYLFYKGRMAEGVSYVRDAINSTPRIISTSEFKALIKNFPFLQDTLSIFVENGMAGLSPLQRAKKAYILRQYDHLSDANKLLKSVTLEMPSLSIPWLQLGDTAKYMFLTYGLSNVKNMQLRLNLEVDKLDDFFWSSYLPKAEQWYGSFE